MTTYQDPQTGYKIRILTEGGKYTKPYFDTESTTPDDKCVIATELSQDKQNLWLIDVDSGDRDLLIELNPDDRFCAPLNASHAWVFLNKTKTINRINLANGTLDEVANVSFCRSSTSGHTEFKNGILAASYHHDRAYYVLAVTDTKSGQSEIIHRTDQLTTHTQACPGDNENLLHVNETGGDALQRMWMFNVRENIDRPYFIEKLDDWVTHECWTRSGNQVLFCKLNVLTGRSKKPDEIWYGDKDGQSFRCVGKGNYHHGAPDVTERWIVADDARTGTITLLDTQTGKNHLLATGLRIREQIGAEHAHPSFNRKGDMVLFTISRPEEDVQVGAIDLHQVPIWSKSL